MDIFLGTYWICAVAILWYIVALGAKQQPALRFQIGLVALIAFLLRIVPALVWGRGDPFDMESWGLFAKLVAERQDLYSNAMVMTHPIRHPWFPFQIYLFAASDWLANFLHLPFVTVVKFLPILADTGIAVLVYKGVFANSRERTLAWRLGLLYAFNPLSIFDASFHGQFDPITIFFALTAWYVLEHGKARWWNAIVAGILLGFAIVDKTWPLIFLPIFLYTPGWLRRLSIVIPALAIPALGVVGYAMFFSADISKIVSTIAGYQSIAGFWGWTQSVTLITGSSQPSTEIALAGKTITLIAFALYYLFVAPQQSLIRGMLNAILLLFVVAPGLNIYYLMWLVPFALLAGSVTWFGVFLAPAFLWLAQFYIGLSIPFVPYEIAFPGLAILLWLMTTAWLMMNLKNISLPRFDPYAILLILFSLFAIGPLLAPGYFWGAHDGRHSVYFLFEFDRSIQDGIFYPRWAPDYTFGYGYPMFNIYAPGSLYASEAFHLLGFDFVMATKIVFALSIILSGLAMFGFVKRLTGSSRAAFVSGLAYVYIPYHIADIYVRAALAESVILIFFPLALWGFYETTVNPTRLRIATTALVYAAMMFSHNGNTLLFTLILGAWVLFLMLGKFRVASPSPLASRLSPLVTLIRFGLPSLAALALGLGLSAIFFIPAVLEYPYVRVDQWLGNYYDYTNHFAYLFQLFNPTWGFGISNPGPNDGMSFQLGVMPVILAILSLIAIVKNPNGTRRFWVFFAAIAIVISAMMLAFSAPVWEILKPIIAFEQFPWRLLALATVPFAILAGAIIVVQESDAKERDNPLPAILLGVLIVFGSFPYLTAQMILEPKEGPVSILGLFRFQQSAGEMTGSTAWVKTIPDWSPMADVYFAGKKVKTKIANTELNPDDVWLGVDQTGKSLRANGERIFFDSQIDDLPITFNTFYYPGWRAYLTPEHSNEIIKELPIEPVGELGRMQVKVPKGRYFLILRFDDSPPRVIGTLISAISVLLCLGIVVWDAYAQRQHWTQTSADKRG